MKINKKIYAIFTELGIPRKEGITYLLSLYFDTLPDYIPDKLKMQVNATNIINWDKTGLNWKVKLFEDQETNFKWVKEEYIALFKKYSDNTAGFANESVARMKKIFSENPDIRKDEILEATEYYLKNTNSKFIMFPHYFLIKGRGADKTSTIMTYIEIIREDKEKRSIDKSKIEKRRKLL